MKLLTAFLVFPVIAVHGYEVSITFCDVIVLLNFCFLMELKVMQSIEYRLVNMTNSDEKLFLFIKLWMEFVS